jgi:hypothetical protein
MNSWFDECREAMKVKNKARNKCLERDTRADRKDYEQKRKDATKFHRKKKRLIINNEMKFLQNENYKLDNRNYVER